MRLRPFLTQSQQGHEEGGGVAGSGQARACPAMTPPTGAAGGGG